jgi:hypothetical protein
MSYGVLACLLLTVLSPQSDPVKSSPDSHKKALAELVGKWRLTGQPRRGSSVGAWSTKAEVLWRKSINDSRISLQQLEVSNGDIFFLIPESPLWKEVAVSLGSSADSTPSVSIKNPDNGKVEHLFPLPSDHVDRFIFSTKQVDPSDGLNQRWTFQRRSSNRWTILVETKPVASSVWSRMIELGMTREGTTIALGDGQKKCVVTGGLGEIEVTVNGRTVFVCCSGCREALLDDPEAFLPKPEQRPEPANQP